jgi:hypothetical protein
VPSDLSHNAGPNFAGDANASQGVCFESGNCTEFYTRCGWAHVNISRFGRSFRLSAQGGVSW